MLLRILKRSLCNRPKAVLLLLLSITMGAAVATAFLGIYGEISHKMALELRSYGANILVEPAVPEGGGELAEADLKKIKTIFWKYNITGFAPYLFGTADLEAGGRKARGVVTGTWFNKALEVEGEETSPQGVQLIAPWWEVAGGWPQAPNDAVVGVLLARRLGLKPGSEVVVSKNSRSTVFKVAGIVTTGGYEENQFFAPLATVQELLAKEGKVSRVFVSALTVPIDEFGSRDPATMSTLDYEKWYCTAYVTSVAKNVEEAMTGSRAKPIWQVASAEGAVLQKFNKIMILLTALALAASAIAVSTSLMASMAERRTEVALMKTFGADRFQIITVFFAEISVLCLGGGIMGYVFGDQLAEIISRSVFNSNIKSPLWLFPTSILAAFAVAVAGSILPLRRALLIKPIQVLKG